MNRYILIRRLRGPAILLLIGGVWLLHATGVLDHPWHWFWPLLMILLGVLMLAERMVLNPPILAGLACYAISVVIWILALSRVDVSIAYPMLSVGYIVTALAGWLLFSEAVSASRMSGICVIIVGVWLVARS